MGSAMPSSSSLSLPSPLESLELELDEELELLELDELPLSSSSSAIASFDGDINCFISWIRGSRDTVLPRNNFRKLLHNTFMRRASFNACSTGLS